MKTLKVTPPPTSEGWSVHVYDGDRHLCCTLEPSHGWALGIGVGVGIFISILFSNLAVTVNSQEPTDSQPPKRTLPSTAESSTGNPMPSWRWID